MILLPVLAGSCLLIVGLLFLVIAVFEGQYLNNTAVIIGHAMVMGCVVIIWKSFFVLPNPLYFMSGYMVLLVAMLLLGQKLHTKLLNKADR